LPYKAKIVSGRQLLQVRCDRILANKQEEIIRVKHIAYCSSEPVVQTGAIDALATYGEQAVDAINEVVNLSDISDQAKEHGLQAIEDIKKNSN
jgi:hypothetical protein